ncbi:MAG: hypothetical protein JNK82_34830 [Myxococcaceae bacterium]|nr:hypothetical protein [Myxococcaceae bacterium]
MTRALLTAAVLAFVFGGCTCVDGICMSLGTTPQAQFFGLAGHPVTVPLVSPLECGSRTPTRVDVSVFDPVIARVESTVSAPTVSSDGFRAELEFTPQVAGTHHVVARFEPELGQVEVDVIVAADRTDAGSIVSSCERGDFTPGGLALCWRTGGVDVLGTTQAFEKPHVARFGSTLWVSDGTTLERWREDGGAFERVETSTAPPHTSIVPGADDALLVASGADVLWWADGGWQHTGLKAPAGNAIYRRGNRIVTVRGGTSSTVNDGTGWCVIELGDRDGGRCTPAIGAFVVGASPDGIAAKIETGSIIDAALFDDRSSTSLRLPPGFVVEARNPRTWDNVALIAPNGAGPTDAGPFVVKATPEGLILEFYDRGPLTVTSTCVTTGTRLIRR